MLELITVDDKGYKKGSAWLLLLNQDQGVNSSTVPGETEKITRNHEGHTCRLFMPRNVGCYLPGKCTLPDWSSLLW
ncbi:hypothetical protein RRG08_022090 [Elysia crispata]|uniref:Uncharacterized protein n=1 Tax=Elysia crispata TaxID=231223 RepID=A0AAE0Y1M6_9GAST|nr:hypothetical protein RRG08_022090 [Elysia crispata]